MSLVETSTHWSFDFLCLRQARLAGRARRDYQAEPGQTGGPSQARLAGWAIMFSTCTFVRPFVCYQLVNSVFWNDWTDCDANWHKWFTRRGHKTVNFEGQEVKGEGHMRPKIDMEASFFFVSFFSLFLSYFGGNTRSLRMPHRLAQCAIPGKGLV